MELSKTVAGGGGEEVTQQIFIRGAPPRGPTPYPFICLFCHEKGTPLYTFYWQMLPLHIPCLELCMGGGGGGILVQRNILPFPLQKQRDHKAWTQPSNVKCTRSSYLHIYNFDNLCYSWFADCSRSTR